MTTFEQRLKDTLAHLYNIERELRGGGMSRVFVAIDRSTRRKVVIKLLSEELVADLNRDRFRREIQVAAQLQHPHIVPLLSAGEHKDLVWYTMPFIAGQSLRSAVEKHGPMPVTSVVRVLYHVGEALDYAHGEGVVHRDIKAVNILRSGTHALVTDFGVAKALDASMSGLGMSQTGMAIGTPAYMAPEQLSGDPAADHRIDIYAVGLLAYELLKGRSRFATTPTIVLPAGPSQELQPLTEVRPDVPRSLSELIMRCLSKEPDDRPATARELLNALEAFSTASGEIRTMEHKILAQSTAPSAAPQIPAPPETTPETTAEPTAEPNPEPTPPNPVPTFELAPPRSNGKKMLAGGLVLLLPIVAGAIFLSQRSDNKSSGNSASPAGIPPLTQSEPVQPQPAAAARKRIAARRRDSRARADSVKNARAEWAKLAAAKDSLRADSEKRAAAKSDSLRRAQETMRTQARNAAAGLLANPGARKSFSRGATHKGGLLGSKTKGDLQTQIDALQPFLIASGLTYEQFKDVVKAAGITLFDEFGRLVPDSLQRFAGVGR